MEEIILDQKDRVNLLRKANKRYKWNYFKRTFLEKGKVITNKERSAIAIELEPNLTLKIILCIFAISLWVLEPLLLFLVTGAQGIIEEKDKLWKISNIAEYCNDFINGNSVNYSVGKEHIDEVRKILKI